MAFLDDMRGSYTLSCRTRASYLGTTARVVWGSKAFGVKTGGIGKGPGRMKLDLLVGKLSETHPAWDRGHRYIAYCVTPIPRFCAVTTGAVYLVAPRTGVTEQDAKQALVKHVMGLVLVPPGYMDGPGSLVEAECRPFFVSKALAVEVGPTPSAPADPHEEVPWEYQERVSYDVTALQEDLRARLGTNPRPPVETLFNKGRGEAICQTYTAPYVFTSQLPPEAKRGYWWGCRWAGDYRGPFGGTR